jgi:large subunit ribosomal protein L22
MPDPRHPTTVRSKAEGGTEMEAKATLNNVRISPRKVQIVLDLIRNKPTDVALATLRLTPKAASPILEKLVKSAIANADNNHSMNKDSLYVAECYVTPGPIMKRVMPRAQGRAYRILKRTSHITVVLKEQD